MNPNDECPWKVLFNKLEKLEDKIEETRIAVVEINHVKEDVEAHEKRLTGVEKVTSTVTILFKALLTISGLAGLIRLIGTMANNTPT